MNQTRQQTWRLALSYLAIIMTLSLVFSVIVYNIISAQLNRPLPPPLPANSSSPGFYEPPNEFQTRIDQRDRETRSSVTITLVLLNSVMLLGGTALSYYLARRTLRPIETAMDAQAQFVSDASHELRTPLTALLITNEVALRKPHIDDTKARDVLTKNISEIEKLRDLSQSLLGLAQAEQDTAAKSYIRPSKLAAEAIGTMLPAAEAKHISVHNEVTTDKTSLYAAAVHQILTILLDNAIKYAPAGSTVTMSSYTDNRTLSLRVQDEGPGVKASERERIFDRFYRSDSARTRTGTSGHGLGLAIARTVAERCSYQLHVESAPKQGAVFILQI